MHMYNLSITKEFFTKIRNKEKLIEYRNNTSYYNNLFQNKYKFIRFHFYQKEHIICKVVFIKLINRPKKLNSSKYIKTKKVFAIKLEFISHNIPKK